MSDNVSASARPGGGGAPVEVRVGSGELLIIVVSMLFVQHKEREGERDESRFARWQN